MKLSSILFKRVHWLQALWGVTLIVAFATIVGVLINSNALKTQTLSSPSGQPALLQQNTPTPTVVTIFLPLISKYDQTLQTATWETYDDVTHGYSFKYPPNWYLKPSSTKGEGGVTQIWSWPGFQDIGNDSELIDRDKIIIEIYVIDNPQRLSTQNWLSSRQSSDSPTKQKQQQIVINDMYGWRYEWNFGSHTGAAVLLEGDKKLYGFNVQPSNSEHLEEFYLLLSTFKLPTGEKK